MIEVNPPTGTVTFLFTDIEGSTRLWDQHPDAMAHALEAHDALLTEVVRAHSGYVFSQAGDGWGISFSSPTHAIGAALEIQDRLSTAQWEAPITEIRVRMGIHTGTSVERDGDYFGTTVNRAARVSAVGSGGQVLVTDTVRTLVADETAGHWRFRDLGEHRLQDLVRAERIWQLDTVGTPAALADIAHHTTHGNLPPARTHVFGRDDDVARLVPIVRHEPLVTLVGMGGVGKTTLAQATARELADEFPAGAWFVDLASTEDAESVSQTVAGTLDINQRPGMSTDESIIDALNTERRLVVLDNAEHVIGPIADLVDGILDKVPDARLVVTSREPLAIDGETIHRVNPLPVGDDEGEAPAVDLFIERAQRVAPDLDHEAFDSTVVNEICKQLDGLPLAIELAASQCETMTPEEIDEAMREHRLTLRSTSRSTTERHRSLTDLVSWSYQRLEPVEQTVFCRLAAFNAGCTAEAARFVCADGGVTEGEVTTSLHALARKSMIVTDRRGGSTRFRMLETLRRFSDDQLSEAPDRLDVEARHARWFADLSAAAAVGMAGPEESRHLKMLLADLANVQKASRWAGINEDFDLMLDIGACLRFFVTSKMRPGMLDWVYEALEVLPPDHAARLDYAFAAAYHALFSGDLQGSPGLFADATAEVANRDAAEMLESYFELVCALFLGNMDLVLSDSERTMNKAYDLGSVRVASALGADLALAHFYTGDVEPARTLATELNERADALGNPTSIAWARYLQGELDADTDPQKAIELLEESVEYSVTVDNEFVAGISLIALASSAGRDGNIPVALDAMDRCIHLFRGAGNRPQLWTAVRNLVEILHKAGASNDALVLHAAAEADADHAPEVFGPIGDQYRAMVAEIIESLGGQDADRAKNRGQRLAYNDAVEFALNAIASVA
ncbi:MAG: adenylate/guanylate cyclase domain-containing protein [Actinomycetota bacterium]